MPDYLLPCVCGQKTAVSTARAGETIRCACGAELQVPTMRALGKLERADAAAGGPARRRGQNWEDRHRAAFLFVLGSLASLGVAAYLWIHLPARLIPPSPLDDAEAVENASPAEALLVYQEMEKGLEDPAEDPNEKPRQIMFWGIGLAVVLAAAAQAGALVVVLGRSARRG
ncbi:MAG: hypothetical protein WD063_15845 [Pirellulales bacterium]